MLTLSTRRSVQWLGRRGGRRRSPGRFPAAHLCLCPWCSGPPSAAQARGRRTAGRQLAARAGIGRPPGPGGPFLKASCNSLARLGQGPRPDGPTCLLPSAAAGCGATSGRRLQESRLGPSVADHLVPKARPCKHAKRLVLKHAVFFFPVVLTCPRRGTARSPREGGSVRALVACLGWKDRQYKNGSNASSLLRSAQGSRRARRRACWPTALPGPCKTLPDCILFIFSSAKKSEYTAERALRIRLQDETSELQLSPKSSSKSCIPHIMYA